LFLYGITNDKIVHEIFAGLHGKRSRRIVEMQLTFDAIDKGGIYEKGKRTVALYE
jgi:hypothetical protein